jgi:putative nucleotidyltransferase with HDIG domain
MTEPSETYSRALKLLLEETEQPESWQKHSIAVSEIAQAIGEALLENGVDVDIDYVTIAALLHDIGRKVDCGTLHGWEGFKLLAQTPFRRYAPPCVTHWLKGRSHKQILEEGDLDPELVTEILSAGNFEDLPFEDKIICIADALARGDQVVTVKDRYIDARKRYGSNAWIDTNEKLTLEFKEEIDALLGTDLYSLFPELSD